MPDMTAVLSSRRVHEIFTACLFRDGEDTSNAVEAEGITMNVGFNPTRLDEHKAEIGAMLKELPEEFQATGGGGWSFLNACMDKHGNHWAEHPTMQELFLLGLATGKVECQMSREMWAAMPGGMPYYVVK